MLWPLAAALSLLAITGCAHRPRALHTKAIQHQAAGSRSLVRGELDRAAGQFSLALEYEPKMAEAKNGLGLVALARGDKVVAETHFREALALNEEMTEAHLNLGSLMLDRDEVDDALVEFRQALAIDPGYGAARLATSEALLRLGRLDDARWELTKLCEIEPERATAHAALALVLAKLNRIAAAETALRRALALDPQLPAALRVVAEIASRSGDHVRAIAALRQLVAAEPSSVSDRLALATELVVLHQPADAAQELEGLEQAAPKRAEVPFVRAYAELRRDRPADAVAAARRALALRKSYPQARLVLAEALLRLGQTGEGRRELQIFVQEAPAHMEDERRLAEGFLNRASF